jgi:hypothetical protein
MILSAIVSTEEENDVEKQNEPIINGETISLGQITLDTNLQMEREINLLQIFSDPKQLPRMIFCMIKKRITENKHDYRSIPYNNIGNRVIWNTTTSYYNLFDTPTLYDSFKYTIPEIYYEAIKTSGLIVHNDTRGLYYSGRDTSDIVANECLKEDIFCECFAITLHPIKGIMDEIKPTYPDYEHQPKKSIYIIFKGAPFKREDYNDYLKDKVEEKRLHQIEMDKPCCINGPPEWTVGKCNDFFAVIVMLSISIGAIMGIRYLLF